jgi:hypothetical protein
MSLSDDLEKLLVVVIKLEDLRKRATAWLEGRPGASSPSAVELNVKNAIEIIKRSERAIGDYLNQQLSESEIGAEARNRDRNYAGLTRNDIGGVVGEVLGGSWKRRMLVFLITILKTFIGFYLGPFGLLGFALVRRMPSVMMVWLASSPRVHNLAKAPLVQGWKRGPVPRVRHAGPEEFRLRGSLAKLVITRTSKEAIAEGSLDALQELAVELAMDTVPNADILREITSFVINTVPILMVYLGSKRFVDPSNRITITWNRLAERSSRGAQILYSPVFSGPSMKVFWSVYSRKADSPHKSTQKAGT